ncbi:MAG: hypothetical protein P1P86_11820 [Bacteroidales bacterium]|nr:hypothetical protein [Bacteroidales bacterium]
MDTLLSLSLKWIHLIATVAWIGGMFTSFLIYTPAIGKTLDSPVAGKLMAAVLKRFRLMVYISMAVFLITGILLGSLYLNSGVSVSGRTEMIGILVIKVPLYVLTVILAIVSFEMLGPRVARIAAEGPGPKLRRAQRSQKVLAVAGFLLGLIILAISMLL